MTTLTLTTKQQSEIRTNNDKIQGSGNLGLVFIDKILETDLRLEAP